MSEFADKVRSLGVIGSRSRSRVEYGRDEQGQRTKAVTDELNNTTTEHQDGRVDVHIRAPHIRLKSEEVRS